MIRRTLLAAVLLLTSGAAGAAGAQTLTAPMAFADGGAAAGTVTASQTPDGVVLKVDLSGVAPGPHGFHVHQNGSCAANEKDGKMVPAGAAGGHYDPLKTGVHAGPEGMGHLGDLPRLEASSDGGVHESVLAPHVRKVSDLAGHAVIVHAGGDNYSDQPAPLGGGGARVVCGVFG